MRPLGRVPPVAVPIRPRHLAAAAAHLRRGDCSARFAAALAERTGAVEVRLFCSGRAALAACLGELARQSPRREVVLPAYACYTVPAAVVRAGLRIRLCDVAPETLDFKPEALRTVVTSDTLAVVAIHPLGLPCDIETTCRVARDHGAVVIENCAQLLGANVENGPAGSRGDVALLSFGRGKPITTLGGGALLTPSAEFAEVVAAAAEGLPPSRRRTGWVLAAATAYGLLARPVAFRLAEAVPYFQIGVTRFALDFDIASLADSQSALGLSLLDNLTRFNCARRRNASALRQALQGLPGLTPIQSVVSGTQGAPLRFPVRVQPGLRDGLLRALRAAGIGASLMYPAALAHVPEIQFYLAPTTAPCPGATEVASSLLTLPCHPGVNQALVRRVRQAVLGMATRAGTALRGFCSRGT